VVQHLTTRLFTLENIEHRNTQQLAKELRSAQTQRIHDIMTAPSPLPTATQRARRADSTRENRKKEGRGVGYEVGVERNRGKGGVRRKMRSKNKNTKIASSTSEDTNGCEEAS
jgi:hypothetical protein